jgi:succinate dehydrogenase / fumarate reductase membrane anchor subunit
MVKAATSLGRTGLQDWLIQRVSAVGLAAYIIFIFITILRHSPLHYSAWKIIFSSHWMKGFTLLALLSLITHAWIGMWTITTDYLKNMVLRLSVQLLFFLVLLSDFFWGVCIIWGI